MLKFTPRKVFSFIFILVFKLTLFAQNTSQITKGKYTYSLKTYKFDGLIADVFFSKNYGLFVAPGGDLLLLNGQKNIPIPYKLGSDSLGAGLIQNFKRDPKNLVYFETKNYVYRLENKIDTFLSVNGKYFGFSLFHANQNQRFGNFQIGLESDQLAQLVSKKKSGVLVCREGLRFYSFQKHQLDIIKEFKQDKIKHYISIDTICFVFTNKATYKITVNRNATYKFETIQNPFPELKGGGIFYCKGNYFYLNSKGLFQLHYSKGIWAVEELIDYSYLNFPGGDLLLDVSPDLKDIFIYAHSYNLYHFRRLPFAGIKMSSSNAILIGKEKYFTNGEAEYDIKSGVVTNRNLFGGYNQDYCAIGNDNYLVNPNKDTIKIINDKLQIGFYNLSVGNWAERFLTRGKDVIGAGFGKIYRISEGKTWYYPIKNANKLKLPFEFCFALEIYNEQLYLATESGLLKYDFESGILSAIVGMPYRDVRTIKFVKEVNAIIAFTYGKGPVLISQGETKKLTLDADNNLLYAHNVAVVNGLAYISTNNGVYVVPLDTWVKSTQNTPPQFFRIDKEDGLPSNECNSGSIHSMVNDSIRKLILVCTVEGLGVISYKNQHFNWPTIAPKIITTSISRKSVFGCKDTIENYSNLEFEISSPYFGNASNLHIEYRISGLTDKWTSLFENKLSLPDNLYGNLTLELRVNSGFDTYISSKYEIYFVPKWNQTIYFKILVLSGIVLLLLLVILIVKKIEQRKRIHLQNQVNERTLELNEALCRMTDLNVELGKAEKIKENLVSVLAHDMRSPLMSIVYTVDHLIKNNDLLDDEESRAEILNEIKFSITKITQFSTEFLKWYALSRGGFKLSIDKQNLSELILSTTTFYDKIIKRDGNTLTLKLDEKMRVFVDSEIFKIVFRNLLDNANKYCDGIITVETVRLNNLPGLRIKNNYSAEMDFPLDSLKGKIEGREVVDIEKEQFKFGLGIISQMAKISHIQILLEYEKPWVSFTLLLPEC